MKDRMEYFKELSNIIGRSVPIDQMLSVATNKIHVDIIKFDEILSRHLVEYDNVNCTYKGEKASMKDVIQKHYGDRAIELINLIMS